MAPKLRRAPDAAVATAVEQVVRQQKSKRMMLFGLRNLSELCSVGTVKYKENALDALARGLVPVLKTCTEIYADDEDVMGACARVLLGMSEGLLDMPDPDLEVQLRSGGGGEAALAILNGCASYTDDTILPLVLAYIGNLGKLRVELHKPSLATGMLAAFRRKMKPDSVAKLLMAMVACCDDPECVEALVQKHAGDQILQIISELPTSDASVPAVETGFHLIQILARASVLTAGQMNSVIKIMDSYKNKKTISDKGSAILVSRLGPNELNKCLKLIAEAPKDSADYQEALVMLASLSYISAYAEAVAKSGGIPTLCNAILTSLGDLSSAAPDAQLVKGLNGACKMLGKIAENAIYVDAVVEGDGLNALADAMRASTKLPGTVAIICDALVPLVKRPALTTQLLQQGTIAQLLEALSTHMKSYEVVSSTLSLLATVAAQEDAAAELYRLGAIPVFEQCLKTHIEDLHIQNDCVYCMGKLLPRVAEFREVAGVYKGVLMSLSKHGEASDTLSVAVLELFERFLDVPDALEALQEGETVDAVLGAMLSHQGSPQTQFTGKYVLSAIATEDDVTRCLKGLDRAITGARRDPQATFRSLAAVNGLSQIGRLKAIFEQHRAAETIEAGIQSWIEAGMFAEQQRIIKAAARSIESLTAGSADVMDKTIIGLLHSCQLPQLKGILEKQEAQDNNVLDIVRCCKAMCAQKQISRDGLPPVIEAIMKVSWKYQDWRRIQIDCLEMFRDVASIQGGARLLQEGGAIKLVIGYMQKVAIYEDVQVAGLSVLATCLKQDPTLAEPLKYAGAVEACKQARSTHADSAQVKLLLAQILPILMPSEASDADIKNAIADIDHCLKGYDMGGTSQGTEQLLGLLTSEEACRIAVQHKVGLVMNQTSALPSQVNSPPVPAAELAITSSKIIARVAESRSGAHQLMRIGGVETLTRLFNALNHKEVPDSPAKREGLAANIYAQSRLLRGMKPSDIAAIGKNQIATFCLTIQDYPEDPRIGGAAAQALAMMPPHLLKEGTEVAGLFKKLAADLQSASPEVAENALSSLSELLRNADSPDVVAMWMNACTASQLFDCLDKHGTDPAIRNHVLDCLAAITRQTNLGQLLVREGGEERRAAAIRTLAASLEASVEDERGAAILVDLLNNISTAKDKALLTSLGVPEMATTLLSQHPDNKQLATSLGDLLGKAGAGEAIESLINQVITTATKQPAEWQRALEALCAKLAATIPAAVDDPAKTFGRVTELSEKLAAISASEKGDAALQTQIAHVARRLADRFEMDPQSPLGAQAITPTLGRALVTGLATDPRSCQNRQFIVNGYRAVAVCAANPHTRDAMVSHVGAANLIPVAIQELQKSQNDAEVTARIFEFLAALSASDQGLAHITAGYPTQPPAGLSMEEHIANDVLQLLRKHKQHGAAAAAGLTLLGNLALKQTKLLDRRYLDEMGAVAEATPLGITAFMGVLAQWTQAGHGDLVDSEVLKVDDRFHTAYNAKTVNKSQKTQLALAYATFMAAVAGAGRTDLLKRALVLDNLATVVEDFKDNPETLGRVLRTLRDIADSDADVNAKIARMFPAILFEQCTAALKGDPALVTATLELLYSLGCNEGNGKIIASAAGYKEFQTEIAAECAAYTPEDAEGIKTLLDSVKVVVEQVSPKAQTLQEVYDKWEQHKLAGETLEIAESAAVMQQFDFVCEYTAEYAKEPLTGLETELGAEFAYGCKCFALLHEYPQNTTACLESGEAQMLLHAMQRQKVEEIAQKPVETAGTLCAHPEGAAHFTALADVQKITIEMMNRARAMQFATPDEGDAVMIPRIDLMKHCAVDRDYYNGTECMATLIAIWDDCDRKRFSAATLRAVFQAMRKIVNASWTDVMRQYKVPKRLIQEVETSTDPALLKDVLYLIGALASVPEMKTLVGELRGVEACLELADRCIQGTFGVEGSPVITNACLALARLTIGHSPNTARFIAARGVEINVKAVNESAREGLDYDVGNGASVLMCNTCYRRDDLKEAFGKQGGPKAISEAIRKYDGSDSRSAFRCLMSMLMAIGNLALYVPNVNAFLEQEVEKTFAHLYANAEFLPDELLEVSLRTMSNLVLENTDEYMTKFGAVLRPLVEMLQRSHHESVKMLALAFEVLGSLSRLTLNADAFVDAGGIDTAIRIVNTHQDPRLCLMVVHAFSVLAAHKDKVPLLIEAGLFTLLTNLFNGQVIEEVGDAAITGLRCVRRMMTETQYALEFIKTGGAEAVVNLIMSSPAGSLVQYEACMMLIALLTMCPPPPAPPTPAIAPAEEDEWGGTVADEGVLAFVHRIERPPSPRAWEVLQLRSETVQTLVLQLCGAMTAETGRKQRKLQMACLHLLAYFACEKIPSAVEGFHAGQYAACITNVFENFSRDYDATKTCCVVLANVSYVSSQDDYKTVAKDKHLLVSLETAANAIPKKTAGEIRDIAILTHKLLAEKDYDPQKYASLVQWDYDLSVTGWNVTQYPNGVQDLPPDVKKQLREGGRGKLVVDAKTRVPFWWKASQDLMRLQWRLSDDQTASYNHQFPVARLRAVNTGLATPLLESAGAKDRKVDAKVCLVIIGPASEDAPSGLELNIKMKSRKERDALWQAMVEWKDAATYGA